MNAHIKLNPFEFVINCVIGINKCFRVVLSQYIYFDDFKWNQIKPNKVNAIQCS